MYVVYLDEITGLAKVVKPTMQGQQLHASFSTIQDFCNAFASNVKVSTPIIPPSCFKYASTSDGMVLFLFYPSKQIDFSIHSRGDDEKKYPLTIPNTVIKVKLNAPNDNKTNIVDAFIYFTDAMLPTLDMKLYKPPFPNIYSDNRICFGGVNRGVYNVKNLFGIDIVHSMFFNNVANTDLWRGESIKGRNYNDPHLFLSTISKMPKEDQLKIYFEQDKFSTIFSAITL